VPFRSTVRTIYDGKDVGVAHVCGHDAHMAILLGVAQILVQMKNSLPGTVKFIFQPAEEGVPAGEEGGAKLMVAQGVLDKDPKPEVIFALHVMSQFETGTVAYREGGAMASSDSFEIVVHGKQTHGAQPWNGIDPVVVASQIVLGLQTITSRQMDLTKGPVVVTVGKIDGGVRGNIVPEEVTLKGSIRALDPGMRKELRERVIRTAQDVAAAGGATATVKVGDLVAYPITFNDPELTKAMLPTLMRVAGKGKVIESVPLTLSEDFSFYQQRIPGLFVFIGIRPRGASMDDYPANHSPRFRIDETGLKLGVRTLANLTLDYMAQHR
jgi:amidohydrolase